MRNNTVFHLTSQVSPRIERRTEKVLRPIFLFLFQFWQQRKNQDPANAGSWRILKIPKKYEKKQTVVLLFCFIERHFHGYGLEEAFAYLDEDFGA